MKILNQGHKYVAQHFENPDTEGTTIQFIEKIASSTGELTTINNGTTNEELLAILVDRLNVLNQKFPCRENSIALTHIETALLWLEKRTRDRIARGVEGKYVK